MTQLQRISDWANYLGASLQDCARIMDYLGYKYHGFADSQIDTENSHHSATYINRADTYTQTLLEDDEGIHAISWGDWVETTEAKIYMEDGLIRCGNCGEFTTAWERRGITVCEHCGRDTSTGRKLSYSWTDKLGPFTRGYITAALWASTNEDDEPMDDIVDWNDIDKDCLRSMCNDCAAFIRDNQDDLRSIVDSGDTDWEQLGGDFWFTRVGHGVGYWENDYGSREQCNRLTKAAKVYGSVDLYIGDDGKVYA